MQSYLPDNLRVIIANCLGYQKVRPYSTEHSNQIGCMFGDVD